MKTETIELFGMVHELLDQSDAMDSIIKSGNLEDGRTELYTLHKERYNSIKAKLRVKIKESLTYPKKQMEDKILQV